MTKHAMNVKGSLPKKDMELDYSSFIGLIKAWFRKVLTRERDCRILEHRLGFQDGYEPVLNECGAVYNLTRERARQILDECYRDIHKTKAFELIRPLWDACTAALNDAGGALSAEELWEILKTQFHFKEPLPKVAFRNVLQLAGFKLFGDDGIYLAGHECLTSPKVREELLALIAEHPEIPVDQALKLLWDRCKKFCKGKATRFSEMTLKYLCESTKPMTERTRIDGDTLYDLDRWQLRHGYFKDALITILKLAGKPMHCDVLHAELAKWRAKNVSYRVLRYYMAVLPETRLVHTSVYAYRIPEKEEVLEDED